MRKFLLINASSESYDLNDLDFFFHDPTGLGYTRSTKYMQIGDIYVPYGDGIKQPKPSGKIRFKQPNAYDKYYDFTRFISKTPLVLRYTPSDTTFSMDCYVETIKKKEIEGIGLDCDITFAGLTPYYKSFLMSSDGIASDGKLYDYTYPYKYSNVAAGTVAIDVDTNMDSPTKISIYGPCENPNWTAYLNNQIRQTGSCNITLISGHVLVIDTTKTPYTITEQDMLGNVIYDRYENSDLSTDRFVFLKKGRNRITISQDGTSIPKLKVEARLYYETV